MAQQYWEAYYAAEQPGLGGIVQIGDFSQVGNQIECTLSAGGVVVTMKEDDDIARPIKAASAQFTLIADAGTEMPAPTTTHGIPVRVKRNRLGDNRQYYYFCGYVLPNSYNEQWSPTRRRVTVNCIDCLSTLKYIDFDIPASDGAVGVLTYIRRAIAAAEGEAFAGMHTLSVCEPYADQKIAQLAVNAAAWYDSDGKPQKWHVVLSAILQVLGLQIIEIGTTKYQVIDVAQYTASSLTIDGTTVAREDLAPTIELDDLVLNKSISLSRKEAVSDVKVKVNRITVDDPSNGLLGKPSGDSVLDAENVVNNPKSSEDGQPIGTIYTTTSLSSENNIEVSVARLPVGGTGVAPLKGGVVGGYLIGQYESTIYSAAGNASFFRPKSSLSKKLCLQVWKNIFHDIDTSKGIYNDSTSRWSTPLLTIKLPGTYTLTKGDAIVVSGSVLLSTAPWLCQPKYEDGELKVSGRTVKMMRSAMALRCQLRCGNAYAVNPTNTSSREPGKWIVGSVSMFNLFFQESGDYNAAPVGETSRCFNTSLPVVNNIDKSLNIDGEGMAFVWDSSNPLTGEIEMTFYGSPGIAMREQLSTPPYYQVIDGLPCSNVFIDNFGIRVARASVPGAKKADEGYEAKSEVPAAAEPMEITLNVGSDIGGTLALNSLINNFGYVSNVTHADGTVGRPEQIVAEHQLAQNVKPRDVLKVTMRHINLFNVLSVYHSESFGKKYIINRVRRCLAKDNYDVDLVEID